MTGSIDHDDNDKDGGNVRFSSISSGGMRKQGGFLLDGFVDEKICEEQEQKGNDAEED